MKILVIGGGGREHAFIWKLKQSAQVEKIWCAPGNGGISNDAECFAVDPRDVRGLVELATRLKPDLVLIGPELPLVLGLADSLRDLGFAVVGPGKSGAMLEGSKVFAKRFMEENHIPTARLYGVFESSEKAREALAGVSWPVVIKADGLCAGKGVLVASSREEAESFIVRLMDSNEFGDGGARILLEGALLGEELSYIVLMDGTRALPFAPARDHKRLLDGDRGPNTGGMGAYSTAELLSEELEAEIQRNVVQPTILGLAQGGIDYRGFLYFGLMLTPNGPKVLEYNCRMGDPETQAILLRADFDLAAALLAVAKGDLSGIHTNWNPPASVCVVLAAKGYPEKPETGARISGLENLRNQHRTVSFHAGTRRDDSNYYVSGGRVLGLSASGVNLADAAAYVYDGISSISFDGMQYRSDIGNRSSIKIRQATKVSRA
jgi:phosphoribosylamine---glycine ligase